VMNGLHLCHDKDVVADWYELVDDAREADPGVLQHRDAVHVGHPTGGRGEPVGTWSRECRGQLAGMRGQKMDADSSYLLERRPHARRAGYQQRDERRPQADRGERRDSQPDRTTPFGCGHHDHAGRVLTQGLPQLLAGMYYLLITVPLTHVVNYIDSRLRTGRHGDGNDGADDPEDGLAFAVTQEAH